MRASETNLKSTFTSYALQNLTVLWNIYLVLYVIVLLGLKKFVRFVHARCKIVLYFRPIISAV